MTVPLQEWATSTVGPSCSANARRVAATESASDVSGFCTAVTCRPAAWRRKITSLQLEPSAHAPCTSTTLRASGGLAVCANAPAANSAAESIPMALTANLCNVFIFLTPLSIVHGYFRFIRCAGAFESIVTGRVELHGHGHAGTVGWIALGEQRDLPALDLIRHALHRRGDVVEQAALLLGVEQAEQVAGLRVVVIADPVVVAIGVTVQRQRRIGVAPVLFRGVERVGLVVGVRVLRVVVEEPHRTVLMIVMHRAARRVDRQRLVMRA